MKKLLALTLTLASFGLLGLGSETAVAKAGTLANASPQVQLRIGPQRHRGWYRRNRVRTITQTRIVRRGFRTYRETYLVRYFGNGQTQTTLISRQRIS